MVFQPLAEWMWVALDFSSANSCTRKKIMIYSRLFYKYMGLTSLKSLHELDEY